MKDSHTALLITLKDPVCWKGSYEELDDAYEIIGKYDELIFALQKCSGRENKSSSNIRFNQEGEYIKCLKKLL